MISRAAGNMLSLLLLLGCFAWPAGAAELNIYAASSLLDVLQATGKKFEKQTGHKLVYNFASSSLLARQIEKGAPADIFFSADEAKMDSLQKAGLLQRGTRRTILKNSLVVVVPHHSTAKIAAGKDLLQFKRIALAEPSSVPAGIYAREFLQAEGLWSLTAPKVIPTENVRAALSAVAGNNAEAAIVYRTDALISSRVKVVYEVPPTHHLHISYPAAILARSKEPAAAEDFLRFLSSEEAQQLFAKHKFILPK